jgi:hypothetical protein
MWEPRCLTTLWASTACYRDSFALLLSSSSQYFNWMTDTSAHICICYILRDLDLCRSPLTVRKLWWDKHISEMQKRGNKHSLCWGTLGKLRTEEPRRWEISVMMALREMSCEVGRWMWNCLKVAFNWGLCYYRCWTLASTVGELLVVKAVLKLIGAGFPPQRPGLDHRSGHAGFGVDNAALGQVFPSPSISPINSIPPTAPHSSYIIRGRYNRSNIGPRTKWTQSHHSQTH